MLRYPVIVFIMSTKELTITEKTGIYAVRISLVTLIVTIIMGTFAICSFFLGQSPSQKNTAIQSINVHPLPENTAAQPRNVPISKSELTSGSTPAITGGNAPNPTSTSRTANSVHKQVSTKTSDISRSVNPGLSNYYPTLEVVIGTWSGTISGEDGGRYYFQLELNQKTDTQDGYSIEGKSIIGKIDEPANRSIMRVHGKLAGGRFSFKELGRELGSSWCAKAGTLKLTSSGSLSGRWYGSETDYNCGRGKMNLTRVQN